MTLSAEVPAGLNMMRTPPMVSTSPVENWLSPPSNTMTALYSRPAKLMTSLIRRSRRVERIIGIVGMRERLLVT